MSILLQILLKNKLATALGAFLLVMIAFSGWQYVEISVLKSRLEKTQNLLESREIALTNLKKKADIQEVMIKDAKARIKDMAKNYEAQVEALKSAAVPQECNEAVNWGVNEINKMISGSR